MNTRFFLYLLLASLALTAWTRTRTTQAHLASTAARVQVIERDTSDSISFAGHVDPYSVEMRGFNKRASDSKESFFLTNRTDHRMSAVRLLLRYSQLDGALLHERSVVIPVDLRPGETRLVEVKSFDTQRLFYFIGGAKPRKSATPFNVAYRLTGYDIPVGH